MATSEAIEEEVAFWRGLQRAREAVENPISDESLKWWASNQSTDDLRRLLREYDTQRAHIARLREQICRMENGGPSGKGHCSVCAFGCYGQ